MNGPVLLRDRPQEFALRNSLNLLAVSHEHMAIAVDQE